MSINNLVDQLKSEGYPVVYEWKDKPGTIYAQHKHQYPVAMYIVNGSIEFDINNKKITIKAGERYDVPPNTLHTALVGVDGCEYIVGQMTEDDA